MYQLKDLHNYQVHAASHIVKQPFSGLFLDMGLGKTIITLTAVNHLINSLDVSKTLIVGTKKIVESVWDTQAKEWEHVKHLTFSKIVGSPEKRRTAMKANADIYLISRDNLAWLIGEYGGSYMPYEMLVVDELSSFKSHDSMRFKALKHVLQCFSRRVGLTGTPAPNGLIDLWSQLFVIDRGERLHKYIGQYRNEFFSPGASSGVIVYKYNAKKNSEQQIYDKISDICISMKAVEYLDMPDKIDNFIKIKMSEKAKKEYDDFEREAVLEVLNNEDITAVNAAVLTNKLLQFSNGAIYDAERKVHELHNEKLDMLEELVEGANGNPVIVATAFRHDTARILKKFKSMKPVELKTSQDEKDWNDGKIQMLLLHPASGGHGINLQKGGNIVIWFGLNWSLELYQQLNARLWRQGQTKPVFIHHLICEGTMDEQVMASIKAKDNKQESLMSAVKALVNKYTNTLKR
jgi:SNF2 family DNA or RNA helicase